jgi:hypothetical protein
MNTGLLKSTKIGDCEVCDTPQVEVFEMQGHIMMCLDCRAAEMLVIEQSTVGEKVIQQMRTVDNTIELKQDVFNASTVAITELKGAIWADDSIESNRKQYVYTKACADHFEKMQKTVFDKRQELTTAENEMRAWQVAAQSAAGALTATEREHFKKININYQPVVKSVKPKAVKPSKSYKSNEYKEAAAKYNVDATAIRMIALQRNLSAEDAAKAFVEIMSARKQANQ